MDGTFGTSNSTEYDPLDNLFCDPSPESHENVLEVLYFDRKCTARPNATQAFVCYEVSRDHMEDFKERVQTRSNEMNVV